jgi:hypothetical protein
MNRIVIALIVVLSISTAQAQTKKATPNISAWPKASQDAAKEIMSKYGNPDEATPTMLVWYKNGPWAKTVIFSQEVPHDFPKPHTDVMQQWVGLKVPEGKVDNLFDYDGSVVVERTTGMISARCDKEGANFLALNLSYDIVKGKRSVNEAREYYTRAVKEMGIGKTDPYMMKLNFGSMPDTGDPDRPSINQ